LSDDRVGRSRGFGGTDGSVFRSIMQNYFFVTFGPISSRWP
jgi:hypothetical protein